MTQHYRDISLCCVRLNTISNNRLTSQNARNFPRMTRNADVRTPVMREHIVQYRLAPNILVPIRLPV